MRRAFADQHPVEKNITTVPLVVDARGPWDRAARVRARRRKAVGQTKTQGRAMLRAGTILHASDGDGGRRGVGVDVVVYVFRA